MKLHRRQTAKRSKEPVRIANRTEAVGSAARSGAATDLRAALEIADSLGELLRIRREVDPLIELPGVLRAAAALRPIPAVVFENLRGYPGRRAVGNLFAEHRRFALMCGLADQEEMTKASFLAALDQPDCAGARALRRVPGKHRDGPGRRRAIYSAHPRRAQG